MRYKCSLVVIADKFEHRETGMFEAKDLDDAMDKLMSKAPEPPDNPKKLSCHIIIERLP